MRAQDALVLAARRLTEAGIAGSDARPLLAHALALPQERLTLALQDPLDPAVCARFEALIEARLTRRPVSHLIGQRLFWGRAFIVTEHTLDPRPETETLIAAALERPFRSLLDLGTGTGCILLTLLAERPEAAGLGVDLSEQALETARKNAERHAPRAELRASDWFSAVQGRFDLIVSNPPYIAAEEMADLSPEVLHEPRMALTPEGDGLAPYRVIAARARDLLAPNGRLLVEIGPTQGPAVSGFFAAHGLQEIRVLPDLDGRDRVVAAIAP